MAGKKAADTVQVTVRISRHRLQEADMIAKLISSTGFEATSTDAIRAGIERGFDAIAREGAPYRISAWDGHRTSCLFAIGHDRREVIARAKELAAQHIGGRWTVFRVLAANTDEPVEVIPVRAPKGR